MKKFSLGKGSTILIYGAGIIGKDIYNKVKDVYHVQCFIDRRTDTGKEMDISVRDPEQLSEYKDCAVIVCVHDGNWHYEIAENLYQHGFNQILFLALSDVYKKEEAFLMKKMYNLFLEKQYDCLEGIPCYSEMKRDIFSENVIRKNELYVTAYCSREMLYSYDKVDEHQKGKMSAEIISYLDVPIIVHKPYIDLFRFFMYGEGSCELYIRNMRQLNNSFDMAEEEFLRSQYLIYQLLEKEYEKGFDAFQYAPIDVKWNPRGYFNVIDGHHRCAFYCLKGLQNMPVRMTREDYNIWVNEEYFEKLKRILVEGRVIPYTRINHPMLQEYRCRSMEFEKTVLDVMQEWLYDEKQTFHSALELSNYQGYYSRNIYRMNKSNEIGVIVTEKEDKQFVHTLNQLQYIPENSIVIMESLDECIKKKKVYELGIVCNMYEVNDLKDVLKHLNDIISDKIFWQSKSDAEAEKNYIINNSKFCNYKHIEGKCVEGRLCEIGVFYV